MTDFNAELYRITHEDDPGMNAMEKIVTGFLIGVGTSFIAFVTLGLLCQAVM